MSTKEELPFIKANINSITIYESSRRIDNRKSKLLSIKT